MSVSEKQTARDSKSVESSPISQPDLEVGSVGIIEETPKDGDEALRFLKSQHAIGEMTAGEEKKLVRKIDWMIMPLMWSCYCLQYLDKTLGENTHPCLENAYTDQLQSTTLQLWVSTTTRTLTQSNFQTSRSSFTSHISFSNFPMGTACRDFLLPNT
jgi:hypothetical protein